MLYTPVNTLTYCTPLLGVCFNNNNTCNNNNNNNYS